MRDATNTKARAVSEPEAFLSPQQPRPGSKQALLVQLLSRPEGASLDDLLSATGWLPHTTRAALTGLRHKGHTLAKSKREDGRTVYRIEVSAVTEVSVQTSRASVRARRDHDGSRIIRPN